MRQVIPGGAGVPAVKGELQHLHAGEAGVPDQLADGVGDKAQILGDDLVPAQNLLGSAEQLDAGSLLPMAELGGLVAVRDGVVFIEATEMVDPGHIVELVDIPQAGQPPVKAGFPVVIPAVQGVAPELARGGEAIGRTACHCGGHIAIIQLEQPGIGPGVGGVHGHIDGDVADDLHSLGVGVVLQPAVLLEELELQILLILDVEVQLPAVVIQGIVIAQADVLGPLVPALAVEEILQGHKEGIVLQPPAIVGGELLIFGILTDPAALIGHGQQDLSAVIEGGVVDVILLVAEEHAVALVIAQNTLGDQGLQIDEVGVAGKGGEGLVGAVAVAGGMDGQDLPVGLSGIPEEVHEFVGLQVEAADAVLTRQAGNGHQNTRGSFHSVVTPLL